jgi:hypothetical protein
MPGAEVFVATMQPVGAIGPWSDAIPYSGPDTMPIPPR